MTIISRLLLPALFVAFSTPVVHAGSDNTIISAEYRVEFGGVSLGKFWFQSKINEKSYSLRGSTRLRLLSGLGLDWKMNMSSGGTLTSAGPKPATFGYNFQSKKKKKKILQLAFANGPDRPMKVEPALKYSKKRVELKPEHFQDVYDPMTALMLLTHNEGRQLSRQVCNRTVKLFDGKERYDIAFEYKKVKMADIGEKDLKKAKSYVCSIRYIPVAGHKRNDKTKKYMSNVKGIEVWFAPFREANIYVPHLIVIPTPLGASTTIRAKSFKIERGSKKKISFIR